MEDLVIMTRPPAWKYAHVLLPGSGELRRVVVLPIQQPNSQKTNCSPSLLRRLRASSFTTAPGALRSRQQGVLSPVLYSAGLQTRRYFLKDLDSHLVSPSCSPAHAGFAMAAAVIAFPIVFFPLRALNNFIIRQLRYAADRCGAAKWAAIRSHGHSPSSTATTQYAYALALLFGFALRSPACCHARCASSKSTCVRANSSRILRIRHQRSQRCSLRSKPLHERCAVNARPLTLPGAKPRSPHSGTAHAARLGLTMTVSRTIPAKPENPNAQHRKLQFQCLTSPYCRSDSCGILLLSMAKRNSSGRRPASATRPKHSFSAESLPVTGATMSSRSIPVNSS